MHLGCSLYRVSGMDCGFRAALSSMGTCHHFQCRVWAPTSPPKKSKTRRIAPTGWIVIPLKALLHHLVLIWRGRL
ncbi:hypothetical protein SAMN04488056_109119 [Cohaesibacter marisflavi]|uniref:Uncharacterized protein n=1 Tax=Cohaesibacter marisflavi TaxID=655353 RepID=A0A1I5IPW1_9HYPH|nr:hypothetical protein SAMN04488056_109119 [Cohaesibacter marisflavi]